MNTVKYAKCDSCGHKGAFISWLAPAIRELHCFACHKVGHMRIISGEEME